MHLKRIVPASFVAIALLAGCGGEPTATETTAPVESEHLADVEQAASATVSATMTEEFPSWWPGSTRITLIGWGSEPVPLHMWCTTGVNDAYITLQPQEVRDFTWWCYGRTIRVHNMGTPGNLNQVVYVRTE